MSESFLRVQWRAHSAASVPQVSRHHKCAWQLLLEGQVAGAMLQASSWVWVVKPSGALDLYVRVSTFLWRQALAHTMQVFMICMEYFLVEASRICYADVHNLF